MPRKTHLERLAEKEHREHPWTTLTQARRIATDHLRHAKRRKNTKPPRIIRQTYKQHLKGSYERRVL